jgi:LacI family transcriptional regulator
LATLKDIAKSAGVSICTVSRYINKKITIRKETAERIDQAIEKLQYIPNSAAKTLKTNSSKNVAILIPTLNNLLFAENSEAMERIFSENGYSVFLYSFGNDIGKEQSIIPRLVENRVAGVVFNTLPSNYENLGHLHMLERNGIPFVFLNRMFSPIPIPSVYANYQKGASMAVDHFTRIGKKKPAIMLGRERQPQSHANLIGFKGGVREQSIPFSSSMVLECDYRHEDIEALVRRALSDGHDSFYCITDLMAIHVINSLKRNGRSVPDDVAVIGAGNSAFSTIVEPQLSSLDLQNSHSGEITAGLLLDIMHKRPFKHTTVLETSLIVRDSA